MYLFFDTETTGLPISWKAPVTNLNNWPRMVQLAYLFYDNDGAEIDRGDFIIKPEGYSIPVPSSNIHGITNERALKEGLPLLEVLQNFHKLVSDSKILIAHNISFDENIVGAEFLRNGMTNGIPSKRKICTMLASTDLCAIPGPYGPKLPKLPELHYKLFNESFDEAHNASVDIEITAKCFWEMRRRGII